MRTTSNLGKFHFGIRSPASQKPAIYRKLGPISIWKKRSMQAGLDPNISTKNIDFNQINLLLQSEMIDYQLKEEEIIKLKEFVELNFKMEKELKQGPIPGADEMLNLLARLAGFAGDMKQLHPSDEVAILLLLQFVNLCPQMNEYYNNDQIEKSTINAYDFIKFKNDNHEEVMITKCNYVKGQLLENAITTKMVKFQSFGVIMKITTLICIFLYMIIKMVLILGLSMDATANEGYVWMSRTSNSSYFKTHNQ